MNIARTPHLNLASMVVCLLKGRGDPLQAYELARHADVAPSVPMNLKAAVEFGTTSSPEYADLLAYSQDARSFAETLRPISILDAMAQWARPVLMRTRIAISATAIVGAKIEETYRKPLRKLTISATNTEPKKHAAQLVVTNELTRYSHPAATLLLNNELRNAVAESANISALADLAATVTTAGNLTSTGSVLADLGAAAAVVASEGAPVTLLWVMSPACARSIATLPAGTGDEPAFPKFDILRGGAVIPGVLGLVTSAVPSGKSLLINPASLGLNLEPVTIRVSDVASYEPDEDSAAGNASNLVSAFQTGAQVMLAERWYALTPFCTDAVATIDGDVYGGSPA